MKELRSLAYRLFGNTPTKHRRSNGRRRERRGVATVECALCLPIMMTLTLGIIETCSILFLKESLTIAAYEGARVGIQKNGTDELAQSRVEEILTQRGIKFGGSAISFSTPGFDSAGTLAPVTTTVTVPCQGNTVIGWFFLGKKITGEATLMKEFSNS